jgi:hypothetical protein
MTAVRKVFGLEKYITKTQYRNLGLLFIAMNAIWFYFTFAENLGIATGQQTYEMPILAVKMWGTFSPTFWLMVAFMAVAFWILVIPSLLPAHVEERIPLFRPRAAAVSAGAIVVFTLLLILPQHLALPMAGFVSSSITSSVLWALLMLNVIGLLLGVSMWLKANPVTATVIASALVVVGMWLERWNIVIPTVTHPMLVAYGKYTPSLTEISISLASVAGFALMFVIFFKLFPAISIWELAEGRVIVEAQSKVAIPQPEVSGD